MIGKGPAGGFEKELKAARFYALGKGAAAGSQPPSLFPIRLGTNPHIFLDNTKFLIKILIKTALCNRFVSQ